MTVYFRNNAHHNQKKRLPTVKPQGDVGSHINAQKGGDAIYAALDLGTNNCRLLIVKPSPRGFRVIDSFSQIVRLGEGLSQTGLLSEEAMQRTLKTLQRCHDLIVAKGVTRSWLITTEACRSAHNGTEFIKRIEKEIGLYIEIIDRKQEAELGAIGCASLADPKAQSSLLFDIGGGSTEIVLLGGPDKQNSPINQRIRNWISIPYGVVNLSENYGGVDVSNEIYEQMIAEVTHHLHDFIAQSSNACLEDGFHLLGTSGTVTTIAALHLNLQSYQRRYVDGLWMNEEDIKNVLSRMRSMSYEERKQSGCIGVDRADLVLAGSAIFEALCRAFPAKRLRIADRGLREGLLISMMQEDGNWR